MTQLNENRRPTAASSPRIAPRVTTERNSGGFRVDLEIVDRTQPATTSYQVGFAEADEAREFLVALGAAVEGAVAQLQSPIARAQEDSPDIPTDEARLEANRRRADRDALPAALGIEAACDREGNHATVYVGSRNLGSRSTFAFGSKHELSEFLADAKEAVSFTDEIVEREHTTI